MKMLLTLTVTASKAAGGAPLWTTFVSGGVALLSLLVAVVALAHTHRARAEDLAPELVGSVAITAGRPDPNRDQGYLVTIQNVGAGDARRVGFLVVLSGRRIGGFATWEGILRPGDEVNAKPRLVKEPGSSGVIHGIAYGDDSRGVTHARPFVVYAQQRTFRSRWPWENRPPTPEAMFAAFYPRVALPAADEPVGLEIEDPIPQGQRSRFLQIEE
jgi:hypothetical protein